MKMCRLKESSYLPLNDEELEDLSAYLGPGRRRQKQVLDCLHRRIADAEAVASWNAWVFVVLGNFVVAVLLVVVLLATLLIT